MPVRSADASWEGNLKDGSGTMNLESGSYQGAYTFASRFEEGEGTNPEELIAGSHAGCFSMAFANELDGAGYEPKRVSTTANVHLEMLDDGPTVTRIELDCEADVPGIDDAEFQEIANGAKEHCPISRLLSAANIELTARLV